MDREKADDVPSPRLRQGYVATTIAILLPLIVMGLYFLYFRGNPVGNTADWGNFGDFVSGIAGPFISAATLVVVLLTLRATEIAIETNKKEMRAHLEHLRQEAESAQQLARIEGALEHFRRECSNFVSGPPFSALPLVDNDIGPTHSVGEILSNQQLRDQVKRAIEGDDAAREHWRATMIEIANVAIELAGYLEEYEKAFPTGGRHVTDFYRKRTRASARGLFALAMISESVFLKLNAPMHHGDIARIVRFSPPNTPSTSQPEQH